MTNWYSLPVCGADATCGRALFLERPTAATLVAERDLLLHIGGTMDQIGDPALNNSGVVAFPAAIFKGPALGGIFVAGARPMRLLVGTGDRTTDRAMILRFSERVAIDDAGIGMAAVELRC